jgi:uncharacterized protein (TIGR00251 family)
VIGVADGRLRLRLAAPAREGKANAELVRFLAQVLGVPRSRVSLTAGAESRRKRVKVEGIAAEAVRRTLGLG